MKNIFVLCLVALMALSVSLDAGASSLDKLKKGAKSSSSPNDMSENKDIRIKSIKKQTSFPGLKWPSVGGFNSQKVRALVIDFKIKTKDGVDCGSSKAVLIDSIERIAGAFKISKKPDYTSNYVKGFTFSGVHTFTAYFFYSDETQFKYAIVFLGNPQNYVMDFFPKGFNPSEELITRAKETAGFN
ncbi:MAG: hypothetical protein JW728_01310 [Candidatus Aureabacteria bacterium]|nr:hypothetical protein [Candidatus Auribacterota bacterium]